MATKVRYLKDYSDPSVAPGYVFKEGWTAEHTDSDAQERIAAGFCELMPPDTRARKLDPADEIEAECIPKEHPGEGGQGDKKTPKRRGE